VIAILLLLAQTIAPPKETAIVGDCGSDVAALREEGRLAIGRAGPDPGGEDVARARELLRRARRLSAAPAISLDAADLAFAAGDAEEGGDLLAQAQESSPASLWPADLLVLARRAEERRRWPEAIARYEELSRSLAARGEERAWIAPHVSDLQVAAQADALAIPAEGPAIEARLALAEGKRALSEGRLREARDKLRAALEASPSYVEAFLALGAVETRTGRPAAAIQAYRQALAVEPDRFEALTALSNLLWEEPNRRARQESLELLARAAAIRPEDRSLDRLLAERWAAFGDAARALQRLDRFRERASAREREETEALWRTLSRQTQSPPEEVALPTEPPSGEPTSAAVDRFRKAQVYFDRGDPESLESAAALAAEAERLDPSLSRIPELAAAIAEKRGDRRDAEDALRRAIEKDPSRPSTRESLARLLESDPSRSGEAAQAWLDAAAAGSAEALFRLGRAAELEGRATAALSFYRRYLAQAPSGLRAADATRAVEALEAESRRRAGVAVGIGLVLLVAAAAVMYRRRSGRTFAEWLAADPARAVDARPIVGRLRHEALKHGGLLLSDAASRLRESDDAVRRSAAELLVARLYGESGARGLVAEARGAMAELSAMARERGVRLNLRRDPIFTWVERGLRSLRRAERSLRRLARPGPHPEALSRREARHLRGAARSFALASGAELERALDRAAALPVRVDALQALLTRVADEKRLEDPGLEPLGALAAAERLPSVRMAALDWETVWRNLFANVLEAGRASRKGRIRLALAAEKRRDPVTGEARLRVILADDLPGLTTVEIRGRAAERGFGVVSELLRRNGGSVEVTAAPADGLTKGVALDLPAVEEPA
jgi:tetratricopeptide (TPR) repeat protein